MIPLYPNALQCYQIKSHISGWLLFSQPAILMLNTALPMLKFTWYYLLLNKLFFSKNILLSDPCYRNWKKSAYCIRTAVNPRQTEIFNFNLTAAPPELPKLGTNAPALVLRVHQLAWLGKMLNFWYCSLFFWHYSIFYLLTHSKEIIS